MKIRTSRVIIAITLLCLAAKEPKVDAVNPPPDGGYPGGNTAEGQAALLSLAGGTYNTAVGFFSLRSDGSASFNTAIGAGTLFANLGDENTATGAGALFANTSGAQNTANGAFALFSHTEGGSNTANGTFALYNNIIGSSNSAFGYYALSSQQISACNTAVGASALASDQNGSFNSAVGYLALYENVTGSTNTAVGYVALLNSTGNNNTALGAGAGGSVETANNVICIGATGADVDNSTWIGNVYGTTTQSGTTLPVVVSNDGQLGTTSSSRRFKKEIKPMASASETILALQPVMFEYKNDMTGTPQFGLVAEDVARIDPNLVVRDNKGELYTVRYEAVNAMLLNEFLKEHKAFVEQQHKVEKLENTVAGFLATVKQQAAQIQKVNAQLELSKRAPQTVANDP